DAFAFAPGHCEVIAAQPDGGHEHTGPAERTTRDIHSSSSGEARCNRRTGPALWNYHTRHSIGGAIGVPTAQPNALRNSSEFCSTPLARHRPDAWTSSCARRLKSWSVAFSHQFCAHAMKKRCAGVKP